MIVGNADKTPPIIRRFAEVHDRQGGSYIQGRVPRLRLQTLTDYLLMSNRNGGRHIGAPRANVTTVSGSTANAEFRSFSGSTANLESSAHEVIRPYLRQRGCGRRLLCWLAQSPRFTFRQ